MLELPHIPMMGVHDRDVSVDSGCGIATDDSASHKTSSGSFSDDAMVSTLLKTGIFAPMASRAHVNGLTLAQYLDITGGRSLRSTSFSQADGWSYDMRYQAQAVLPFLLVGPYAVARSRLLLRLLGVTMVLGIRDSRFASRQMLGPLHESDACAEATGAADHIAAEVLDVADAGALLRALPRVIYAINQHLLAEATPDSKSPGRAACDAGGCDTGRKVLVYCETGNTRAPAVAVAYLLAMYGASLRDSLRRIVEARTSTFLSEEDKNMLQSFGDMHRAQYDVAMQQLKQPPDQAKVTATADIPMADMCAAPAMDRRADISSGSKRPLKRNIDDSVGDNGDGCSKFRGPTRFSPFIDRGV